MILTWWHMTKAGTEMRAAARQGDWGHATAAPPPLAWRPPGGPCATDAAEPVRQYVFLNTGAAPPGGIGQPAHPMPSTLGTRPHTPCDLHNAPRVAGAANSR